MGRWHRVGGGTAIPTRSHQSALSLPKTSPGHCRTMFYALIATQGSVAANPSLPKDRSTDEVCSDTYQAGLRLLLFLAAMIFLAFVKFIRYSTISRLRP